MPLRANSFAWGKLRLATRVMLVSGVVLMLFGATFLALIVSSELRVTRDELEQRLDHEVDFLVPAIAESAVVGDYALLKQMLDVRVSSRASCGSAGRTPKALPSRARPTTSGPKLPRGSRANSPSPLTTRRTPSPSATNSTERCD